MTHKRALRISVDLAAIQHNLEIARIRSGGQKLFAVVKADAYGHGAVQVAGALSLADGFAVVTLAEAIELRQASIDKPILVLQSAQSKQECDAFYEYQLWPVIHCADQYAWFSESGHAGELQPWIKIDTGMGRLGFQAKEAARLLSTKNVLSWAGAMTHFASADEPESAQTQNQIDRFANVVQPHLIAHPSMQLSLANSAGVLAWPASQANWARPGIILYGSNPIQTGITDAPQLRAAMRVSAPLISLKQYNAGDSIGYAASYTCTEAMRVGYVAIGYGDGLPRVLDASATVYIQGEACPIIGRVSMDSIAVDLRKVNDVQLGEHAVLWGEEHPVEILARAANTISYELLTSIKGPRAYS